MRMYDVWYRSIYLRSFYKHIYPLVKLECK
nr:MAG TPA: hypothetical protein [Caudoviricetes sp.]